MNEQIMKILPAKKESSYNMPDDWITGYNRALKDCAAAIEKANLVRCPTEEEILGAVARGWCDEGNSHKVMDVVLAVSIAKSLLTLLRGDK